MSKQKCNGEGRHHHYSLGDEVGKIKTRLDRIEWNLKIIRTLTPNTMWRMAKSNLIEAEIINKEVKKLFDRAIELDIGDFTDL